MPDQKKTFYIMETNWGEWSEKMSRGYVMELEYTLDHELSNFEYREKFAEGHKMSPLEKLSSLLRVTVRHNQ